MTTEEFIRLSLSEDQGNGDHTTLSCIPSHAYGSASLLIKANGVLAGIDLARQIFKYVEPEIQFEKSLQDGDAVHQGMQAFHVEGKIHTILLCERLVLNCMQRMSGIASLTSKFVDQVKPYGTKILDTRKTSPLMRHLEKKAVLIGGGHNHRMGLFDMILIKDNHVDFAGGISKAIKLANEYVESNGLAIPIEVETRSIKDVEEVLSVGGVNRIMFDNFDPKTMLEAVKMVNDRFETEASGGITLDNVSEYASTGVNCISVGALTHSAVSLDLSLKAVNR
jgi:nicotinate-nucleotide pyrophosphorylase (carboxylating)